MVISSFIGAAIKVGIISGNLKITLIEEISILYPTLLFTVQRVLQIIRMQIFDGFNYLKRSIKKMAYNAYHTYLKNYKKYGIITYANSVQILFKKIRIMFDNIL
jgi:long-subunit acyl-CoA synthetase (AMP-forming)